MIASGSLLRVTDLLGAPPDQVREEELAGLVRGAVREDADLEFKAARYGSSDSDKRELAADVAAMANARGGVIIIGVEDTDDVATALTPVEVGDGEEARIRQVVAGNVTPHMPFEVVRVGSDDTPDRAYYLLVVPPSPLSPHAVRKGIDLRFPRRDGTTTRWLSEAEVADSYRDRFRLASDQVSRSTQVLGEGWEALDCQNSAYLAVALIPSSGGAMQMSQALVRSIETWSVDTPGTYAWRGFFGSRPTARAGSRRVRLAHGLLNNERPRGNYAELHTDGSGFACECVSAPRGPVDDGASASIPEQHLVWELGRCLRLLGKHAVENAGAWGDAIVSCELTGPAHLTYAAPYGFDELVNREPIDRADSHHTIPLDAIAAGDQALLASTRLVAMDLVNAFGWPEVRTIAPDGSLRLPYLRADQRLLAFAESVGVATTSEGIQTD